MKATVFQIARASLHDGDGVRTVVYLKGCSLRCAWCHNPEGLVSHPEIFFYPRRCVGCGRCVRICPKCHVSGPEGVCFVRELCSGCGRCSEACPGEALILSGREMTAAEAFREVEKDAAYYARTGGGVTLSGGECLLYPEFCRELILMCRKGGINTAVETALSVPWENVEAVLPLVDTFMTDLKHADPALYHRHTGGDLRLVLDNMDRLIGHHPDVRIRIPLIPGVNDGVWIPEMGKRLDGLSAGVAQVELLRYNPAAKGKYDALGRPWTQPEGALPQTDEEMDEAARRLREALPSARVFYR